MCPEESLRRFEEEEIFLADFIAACEKCDLGLMREFNSRGTKRDFGLHEDRCVRRVLGKPYPQPRVGQFLAMIE